MTDDDDPFGLKSHPYERAAERVKRLKAAGLWEQWQESSASAVTPLVGGANPGARGKWIPPGYSWVGEKGPDLVLGVGGQIQVFNNSEDPRGDDPEEPPDFTLGPRG